MCALVAGRYSGTCQCAGSGPVMPGLDAGFPGGDGAFPFRRCHQGFRQLNRFFPTPPPRVAATVFTQPLPAPRPDFLNAEGGSWKAEFGRRKGEAGDCGLGGRSGRGGQLNWFFRVRAEPCRGFIALVIELRLRAQGLPVNLGL